MTSDKQNVSLLADIFVKKGLSDIVISPGSRNAPIVIAFAGNKNIRALSVIDERSAGFFAMGMAQQLGRAVAVACTSGSAALNYAPAIAEAYYQKIPLLVLTADRPPEMIDQGDGQTIRQKDVFQNYIKKSFELPVIADDPATRQIAENIINSAIDQTSFPEPGPVHINIPFREPLYGTTEVSVSGRVFDTTAKLEIPTASDISACAQTWNKAEKILIIAGQMPPDPALNKRLAALGKLNKVVVLTETTSNLHSPSFIDCIDNVVSTITDEEETNFQPDLLISMGGQIVSKMIKKQLRLNPPKKHWHISPSGDELDTYFMLSNVIRMQPVTFFQLLASHIKVTDKTFNKTWSERKAKVEKIRTAYLEKLPFCDFRVFEILLNEIPANSLVHLGNSTPVRYSQLFGSSEKFTYHSNRGVSGIDGQVSTAAGAAFANKKLNTIITGDLGFFYDSNSLMNQSLTPNLKIIVINNKGGGIFRFIPGPDKSPFLEEFFETRHNWNAKKIAETFDVNYFSASSEKELLQVLREFYGEMTSPALLEIFTPPELNAEVLKNYFKELKQV
jgi:2-succinyl-5-enolpyruvyl-6-hydroxy-3-cyclohexene-1-carboxylate synthase